MDADGNESAPRGFATSGFLSEFAGEQLFITAGHLLHDIGVELPRAQRQIVRSALLNPWAANSPSCTPVYVDYACLPQSFEDDDAAGTDLGMIRLPADDWAVLLERGATPVRELQLHRPQDLEVSQYWICGVPSELTDADTNAWLTNNDATIELEPFCFQVQRLIGVAGGFTPTTRPRFYASIPAEVPLGDLDGVSGAPVFSLTRNSAGTFDIWLDAVQSRWKRSVRNIAATPFPESIDIMQRGCLSLSPPASSSTAGDC
ncbi:MAG: hypothetical protein NTY19_01210 [Planctomycetota bacterium]|nr:hypothetical protein [Planctomycetota bacterium]